MRWIFLPALLAAALMIAVRIIDPDSARAIAWILVTGMLP
jgi:hypothetical protein